MATRKKATSASSTATTPASTACAQTGNSIPCTDIVNLGKKLVQELGLENSTDTTARWMAHYLAELMARAETAQGPDKAEAEWACFEAIVQLWQQRAATMLSGYVHGLLG